MNVKVAKTAGFCFGVKRAVDTAYELSDTDGEVVTLGPIIHNQNVVDDLASHGVQVADSIEDIPEGATTIIRSHGVSKETIDRLESKNITYVDCTCPFVKKIHETVRKASEDGDEIVIVGTSSHPEVVGILGWAKSDATVIETAEEAKNFVPSNPDRQVCVVAQTTFNSKKFQELVEIFEKKVYHINIVNTICHATQERQDEAESLASESEAMLIIGDHMSSNSRKLYDICNSKCSHTFFIQTADELKRIDLSSFASLSITAGASTPNTLIQEVIEACQR